MKTKFSLGDTVVTKSAIRVAIPNGSSSIPGQVITMVLITKEDVRYKTKNGSIIDECDLLHFSDSREYALTYLTDLLIQITRNW